MFYHGGSVRFDQSLILRDEWESLRGADGEGGIDFRAGGSADSACRHRPSVLSAWVRSQMRVQSSFDKAKGSRYTDGKSVLAKFRDGRELQALRDCLACTGNLSCVCNSRPMNSLCSWHGRSTSRPTCFWVLVWCPRVLRCDELTVKVHRSAIGCDAVFLFVLTKARTTKTSWQSSCEPKATKPLEIRFFLLCNCGLTRSVVYFVRLRCGSSGSSEALS